MKNLSQIEGNIGQSPKYTKLPSGKEVTRFSVAINKSWRKNGEKKTSVDWFNVEAWGHLAGPASRLTKGASVFVQGELRTGSYKKQDVNVPTTYIVAMNLRKIDNSIYAKDEAPDATVPDTDDSVEFPGDDDHEAA